MICKHFNLSWVDIRDDITLPDYICLLAEALDAEEMAAHEFATLSAISFHNPKYLKKWKWASTDKAGTVNRDPGNWAAGFTNMALELSGGMKGMSTVVSAEEALNQREKVIKMALARGRRVIYMTPDMRYFDENGNPTTRDSLCSIIRVNDEGEIFH